MTFDDLINDIPEDTARRAHSGISFDPEARAKTEREGYARSLLADFEALSKYADTDDKRATLTAEFSRYRDGYRTRYLAMLAAKARCMSTMITGGSNFPVRRQAKINATADKRTAELIDFHKRALEAIKRTLRPEDRPIMAGDADAVPRLDAKLVKAEADLDFMRRANAAIRKHKRDGEAAQIEVLVALDGSMKLTPAAAAQLLKPDFANRIGFADYEIRNLAANIRRMRARSETIAEAKAVEATTIEGTSARFEDCPADNRVRLFFPGKPDSLTRSRLKSAGFRWTPSLGCWQAYRNHHAMTTARREAGVGAA